MPSRYDVRLDGPEIAPDRRRCGCADRRRLIVCLWSNIVAPEGTDTFARRRLFPVGTTTGRFYRGRRWGNSDCNATAAVVPNPTTTTGTQAA